MTVSEPATGTAPSPEREFLLMDKKVRALVGRGLFDDAPDLLAHLDADRYVVVTDDNVRGVAAARLAARLETAAPTLLLSQPPGEEHKTLQTLSRHIGDALDFGITRRSVVVAAGGGVPGNTAGLLAGLLFRGVRLAHFPTSTIAACDSVLSAKQAVNTRHAKNTVGLYHSPEIIVVDLDVVAAGPRRDQRSGVCETIKNALALAPAQIPELRGLLRPAADYSRDDLARVFELSIEVKGALLEDDPYEKHAGVLLEYGHTVGHALELAAAGRPRSDGPLRHGEAIALGMLAAARIAVRTGLADGSIVDPHEELVATAGVCRCLVRELEVDAVMHHVEFDNKRGYHRHDRSEVPMVLLAGLGVPAGAATRYLTPVPKAVVREEVAGLLEGGRHCGGGCGA